MAELRFGLEHVDFPLVHRWLTDSYWSPGITLEKVKKAAAGSSLLVSAYVDGSQVGYLRVVSDGTTFAWVADVWVDEPHRGQGIAQSMVNAALEHPGHQGLRRWVLATRDAHRTYEACGFGPLPYPERWMVHFPEGSIDRQKVK